MLSVGFQKTATRDHLLAAKGSYSLSEVSLDQMFTTVDSNLLRDMIFLKQGVGFHFDSDYFQKSLRLETENIFICSNIPKKAETLSNRVGLNVSAFQTNVCEVHEELNMKKRKYTYEAFNGKQLTRCSTV